MRDTPSAAPRLPVALGAAGLIPFLALTAACVVLEGPLARLSVDAVAVYGVIILAFLGGVHWGRGLASGRALDFLWSVTPALIGFFAAFLPAPWALGALSAAFTLAGIYDVGTFRHVGPQWYARLRVWLTLVVAIALAIAAWQAPGGHSLLGSDAPAAAGTS